MTLAIRDTPAAELAMPQDHTITRLVEWAQAADAAYQMASKLANTAFIPAKYRGKPAEMTAAILAGAELGLDPMASLRAFHDIQGTPTPSAMTLRAVVQGHGHEVRIDQSSDEVAVVSGRRRGTEDWQTSTWTYARADKAGFPKKNPNWGMQRAAMLIARATAEVCRWIGSDAIMGMPYSAEELEDMAGDYVPAPSRVTPSEILGGPEVPPVPVVAEPVSAPPVDAEPMTRAQQGKMFALFGEKGLNSPAQQRDFVAGQIGRQIASRGDLTKDEAKAVIDALEQLPMPAAEPVQDVDMGGAELDDAVEGELQ